jgi:hypothetical protein
MVEKNRGSGFIWSRTVEYGEDIRFWLSIMKRSDFRPYYELYGQKSESTMKHQTFAVGDKVCLSESGKRGYLDSDSNPHHDIGRIYKIDDNVIFVKWSEGKNAFYAVDLILAEDRQDVTVQNFAVGDVVMLNGWGMRNYNNSWNNPYNALGVITSLLLDDCYIVYTVRWEGRDFERKYAGYELKLVNNNKKEEDDKILFRITPTITPGEAPSGIVVSSPATKIRLGS